MSPIGEREFHTRIRLMQEEYRGGLLSIRRALFFRSIVAAVSVACVVITLVFVFAMQPSDRITSREVHLLIQQVTRDVDRLEHLMLDHAYKKTATDVATDN